MTLDLSTESTNAIYAGIRKRLLTFENRDGDMLEEYVTVEGAQSALYNVQAPDTAPWPHVVQRLMNSIADSRHQALNADLEVFVYGRPRAQQPTVEVMADLVQQAMMQWRPRSDGVIWSRAGAVRDTIPYDSAPANRELCAVRLVVPLRIWPKFLTETTAS